MGRQREVCRPRKLIFCSIGIYAQFTVPTMALKVLDRSMQAFGAEGICQDQPLAQMFAGLRTLRYADVSVKALLHGSLDRPLTTFSLFKRDRMRYTCCRSGEPS